METHGMADPERTTNPAYTRLTAALAKAKKLQATASDDLASTLTEFDRGPAWVGGASADFRGALARYKGQVQGVADDVVATIQRKLATTPQYANKE
jgi:hypothetical protein